MLDAEPGERGVALHVLLQLAVVLLHGPLGSQRLHACLVSHDVEQRRRQLLGNTQHSSVTSLALLHTIRSVVNPELCSLFFYTRFSIALGRTVDRVQKEYIYRTGFTSIYLMIEATCRHWKFSTVDIFIVRASPISPMQRLLVEGGNACHVL